MVYNQHNWKSVVKYTKTVSVKL